VFWFEYFWFAPNLAKIAEKQTEDARRATEEAVARILPNATETDRASVLQAAEAQAKRDMEFTKHKLDRLNDFRGVSVPIWAAVLAVLLGLYTNNVKIKEDKMKKPTNVLIVSPSPFR
jgi:hypothetical protein